VAAGDGRGICHAADCDATAFDLLAGGGAVEQPAKWIAADYAELERLARRRPDRGRPFDIAGEFGNEGGLDGILGRLGARRGGRECGRQG
jgi:hypothetical protein